MKLATNKFKQGLLRGEKQVGLWVSLCSAYAAEAVSTAGFDWALLDMEHSPGELSSIMAQLQVFAASGTSPIVRPDWNDTVKVKRLLDLGTPSLLFPMVQNVEEARAAVAATRYPPKGIRGVAGTTRANAFGRTSDYFERVDDETCVIVQVETQSAMAQAEEIAAVEGIDGIFFGPADIGADLGILGKPLDPRVWDAIRPVAQRLKAKGVPIGTLITDPKFAAEMFDEGFDFIACGIDSGLLARGADNLIGQMRASLGQS